MRIPVPGLSFMQMICCNMAALAVAGLYYYWRAYSHSVCQRERMLRERVAYMLWVMAGRAD